MKKEVLIAIIIGFIFGLVITVGIYTARKSLNARDQMTNPQSLDQSPTGYNSNSTHSINITSPPVYTISDTTEVTITGITTPNSMVAAISTESHHITSADNQGNFSSKVTLDAGENIVKISSYDISGNSAEINHHLIYSTADLSDTIEESNTNDNQTQNKPESNE